MPDKPVKSLSSKLTHGWAYEDLESQLDPTTVMLLFLSRYGHMPELYSELGQSIFLKLIKVFGGMKLVIPTQDELSKVIKEVHIYTKVKETPLLERKEIRAELAEKHDVHPGQIHTIFARIEAEIKVMSRDGQTIAELRREEDQTEAEESAALLQRLYEETADDNCKQ